MTRRSRSQVLLDKAESAIISAIEIFNKPDFHYREETFAILALNAWELLLKAKHLADCGNALRSIYQYERRRNKNGELSKKLYVKRNRAGNIHTLGLGQVIVEIDKSHPRLLPKHLRDNLDALIEIRDNAVHFVNPTAEFAQRVLEIGTATVRNFIEFSKLFFSRDLSQYNLYLMPIGFVSAPGDAAGVAVTSDERRLCDYLRTLIQTQDEGDSGGFHVALAIDLKFRRVSGTGIASLGISSDPGAPKVQLSEENIRHTYPWDYAELTRRLRHRYSDFKVNRKYHGIRKNLEGDRRFAWIRHLDPSGQGSTTKTFFNSNILNEFDKSYARA